MKKTNIKYLEENYNVEDNYLEEHFGLRTDAFLCL